MQNLLFGLAALACPAMMGAMMLVGRRTRARAPEVAPKVVEAEQSRG